MILNQHKNVKTIVKITKVSLVKSILSNVMPLCTQRMPKVFAAYLHPVVMVGQ